MATLLRFCDFWYSMAHVVSKHKRLPGLPQAGLGRRKIAGFDEAHFTRIAKQHTSLRRARLTRPCESWQFCHLQPHSAWRWKWTPMAPWNLCQFSCKGMWGPRPCRKFHWLLLHHVKCQEHVWKPPTSSLGQHFQHRITLDLRGLTTPLHPANNAWVWNVPSAPSYFLKLSRKKWEIWMICVQNGKRLHDETWTKSKAWDSQEQIPRCDFAACKETPWTVQAYVSFERLNTGWELEASGMLSTDCGSSSSPHWRPDIWHKHRRKPLMLGMRKLSLANLSSKSGHAACEPR